MLDPTSQEEVGNPAVRAAIVQLCDDPSAANRRTLYDRLLCGSLILAIKDLPVAKRPVGNADGLYRLYRAEDDADVQFLWTTAPYGGLALLAFTDFAAVRERNPNANITILESVEVLRMALKEPLCGLVLNPGGPWAYVPREHIVEMLE